MSSAPSDPRAPASRPLSAAVIELVTRAGLLDLLDKIEAGERLSQQDGERLFEAPDLAAVGAMANRVRERLHGDLCFFNRNLHINATNVCEASCIFCSFARLKTGDPQSWTMSIDQAVGRVAALSDVLVTEVHIVNGLNPDLPFDYYSRLMAALKAERPDLHVKGFTAVEIHYYAEKYGMSYEDVLVAFRQAGLESMPGGGAEIFADRARKKLCHDKVDADGWLDVHRTAHRLGIKTNCTMLFGSIETLAERVDHLVRLRELQDESLAGEGAAFQTLIPLRFHNENNRLQRLRAPTGQDSLRTIAVSRLMLDNIPHIKAYWPMLGIRTAQLAQVFGSDDLDGTVREEHIYHMAGASTPQGLHRHELVRLVEHAGRKPVERDTLYRIVRRDDPVQPDAFGDQNVPLPRIGAVGYTNTWPLVSFLSETGPVQIRTGHPAEVADWLLQDEVDLALLPVGALLTDPDLRVVPDLCIGCDGPVHSVLLTAETPPEQWTRVVLDGVSRTSVLLARLLLTQGPLKDRVPADLEIVEGAAESGVEAARGTVAAVVIGDTARRLPARLTTRVDLGAQWKAWTGLPFVFAVWAGRPDVHPAVVERVRAAGLRGLSRLHDAPAQDRAYLEHSIRFTLDDAAMMGLRRFAALAFRAGLVPQDTVDLYAPRADLARTTAAVDIAAKLNQPDQATVAQLLRTAPLTELIALSAAHGPGSGQAVPYRVGCRVPVTASAATTTDAIAGLAEAGGSVVWLVVPPEADLDICLERVRALAAADLQVMLSDATTAIARLSAAAALPANQVIGALSTAGVSDAELLLSADLPADDARIWAAAGVRLHLVLTHGTGASAEDDAGALLHARDLAQTTDGVHSFTVRSLDAARTAVPAEDNTAVGWLRKLTLARTLLPETVVMVAQPATEGLDAVQTALAVGAGDLGTLLQGELVVPGTPDFYEAVVEVERAIEDADRQAVRLTSTGSAARPALDAAGRLRPLPSTDRAPV